jgi:ribosomal protein S18 acetylase RimI-like enzyme
MKNTTIKWKNIRENSLVYRERDNLMRVYETKDYELVAKLNKPVQELHAKLFPDRFFGYDEAKTKEFFKAIINKTDYLFLVIEDQERPMGYAWIEVKDRQENASKKGSRSIYVHQISVEGAMRHMGYGSRLMDEVEELAKKYKADRVELDYWVGNEGAEVFYKKRQFEPFRRHVYKTIRT